MFSKRETSGLLCERVTRSSAGRLAGEGKEKINIGVKKKKKKRGERLKTGCVSACASLIGKNKRHRYAAMIFAILESGAFI